MKLEEIETSLSEAEELAEHLTDEIQLADKNMQEIKQQMTFWEHELDMERKKLSDFPSERMQEIEQQLDRWQAEYDALAQEKDELISERKSNRTELSILSYKRDGAFIRETVSNAAANGLKKVAAAPFSIAANTVKNTVKSGVKSAISKANPFDKKINKNDVADTGMESMRLVYRSVKQSKNAIKTVGKSIKTTQRTIKTSGTAIKRTGNFLYRTSVFAVKSIVLMPKLVSNATAHIIAAMMNPVVIIIIGFLIILMTNVGAIIALICGGIAGAVTTQAAYSSAAGLTNVEEEYQNGLELYKLAVEKRIDAYEAIIDGTYFDYNDMTNSDLIYMECTINGTPVQETTFDVGFAVGAYTTQLKNAWDSQSLQITDAEALAIAYVYLEKQENIANGTEGGIYQVTYTQAVFDEILEICVQFTDSIFENQPCPSQDCTRHVEMVDNPDYTTIWNAYSEWADIAYAVYSGSSTWDAFIASGVISNWQLVYGSYVSFPDNYQDDNGYTFANYLYNIALNTPAQIEEITYICEYQHDLHSIGLAFYTKEDVMNALDFTDLDREWENLTEEYFTEYVS